MRKVIFSIFLMGCGVSVAQQVQIDPFAQMREAEVEFFLANNRIVAVEKACAELVSESNYLSGEASCRKVLLDDASSCLAAKRQDLIDAGSNWNSLRDQVLVDVKNCVKSVHLAR